MDFHQTLSWWSKHGLVPSCQTQGAINLVLEGNSNTILRTKLPSWYLNHHFIESTSVVIGSDNKNRGKKTWSFGCHNILCSDRLATQLFHSLWTCWAPFWRHIVPCIIQTWNISAAVEWLGHSKWYEWLICVHKYICIYSLGAGGSPKVLWLGYCECLKIVISLWWNVSFWRRHSLHKMVFCADDFFDPRVDWSKTHHS